MKLAVNNPSDSTQAIELNLFKLGIEKIGEAIADADVLADDLPESAHKNQFLVFIDSFKKIYEQLQAKIAKAQPKEVYLKSIREVAKNLYETLQQKLNSLANSKEDEQEIIMLTPIMEEIINTFPSLNPKPIAKPAVNDELPEITQTKKWVMQACYDATAVKLAQIFNGVPSIFISYSWTNPLIVQLVRRVAESLKKMGSQFFLDVWQNTLGTGINAFIEKIANEKEVNGIMLMGSPDLVKKYKGTDNVVKLEQDLIFARYKRDQACVIPVLMSGKAHEAFPEFLGRGSARVFTGLSDHQVYDLSDESQYYEGLCKIINRLAEMAFPGERFIAQRQQVNQLVDELLVKLNYVKDNRLSSSALIGLYEKYQKDILEQNKILAETIVINANAFVPANTPLNYANITTSIAQLSTAVNDNNNSVQSNTNHVEVNQNVTTNSNLQNNTSPVIKKPPIDIFKEKFPQSLLDIFEFDVNETPHRFAVDISLTTFTQNNNKILKTLSEAIKSALDKDISSCELIQFDKDYTLFVKATSGDSFDQLLSLLAESGLRKQESPVLN